MELCCWWCTLDIPGEPLELPYKIDKTGKYHVVGKFCSWECMKSYNMHENRIKFGEIQCFMTSMRRKMCGGITRIGCAPSRYCLTKFGGTLTPEEFRAKCGPNPPILRMPDKENFIHETIERNVYVSKKTSGDDDKKLSMINKSITKSETLKLKRPVPIKRDSNNLESALGIIRKAKNV